MASLKITYRRSSIGQRQSHKDTVRSLGLRKLNQSVIQPDNPSIRGMVHTVRHLVVVEEIADDEATTAAATTQAQ